MSYYYPYGTGESKDNISYASTAVSASYPENVTTLMPTSLFATTVVNTPAAGTSGLSKQLSQCTGTQGTTGAQGAVGPAGNSGNSYTTGQCPPGTKECTGLNSSLAAINTTQGPNDQFGVVCLDLQGKLASSLDCPGSLPSGVPTLPAYA